MARENSKGRDRKRTSFGKQQDAEKSFYKKKSEKPARFDDEKPKRAFSGKPRFGNDESKSTRGSGGFSNPFQRRDKPEGFKSDDRSDRPKRFSKPFGKREGYGNEEKTKRSFGGAPFKKSEGFKSREDGAEPKRFSKSFGKKEGYNRDERPKRSFGGKKEFGAPFKKREGFKSRDEGAEPKRFSKPFEKKEGYNRDERPKRSFGDKKEFGAPFKKRESFKSEEGDNTENKKFSKPFVKRDGFGKSARPRTEGVFKNPSFSRSDFKKGGEGEEKKSFVQSRMERQREDFKTDKTEKPKSDDGLIRLNKFMANSGVGSRREADELIKMGLVTVNGETITEMGHKVKPTDDVRYEGRKLKAEKLVYVLLNKPKGFITTTEDPEERSTVMQLVAGACKERIYPVGRLDRNTTGLLLLTNDGDLADKLTHPSYNAKKIYKVELDKPISKNDFDKIKEGVQLEEGRAMVDDLAMVSDDKKTVGIEIHIGWNRIVRRIFEALGYEVQKLDRVVYAGLDKKDLGRGQWRFLKPEEVVMLKHFSK
jgi:23S rRNA pseudouridine2605 synthase